MKIFLLGVLILIQLFPDFILRAHFPYLLSARLNQEQRMVYTPVRGNVRKESKRINLKSLVVSCSGKEKCRIHLSAMIVADNHEPSEEKTGNHKGVAEEKDITSDEKDRRNELPVLTEDEEDDLYTVWNLLPDRDYSEKLIHFGDVRGRGAGSHLIRALSKKLFENKAWLTTYNESHLFYRSYDYLPDVYDFSIYKGEVRDINYIRRDIAIRTVSEALAETFEKTPLGEKVKRIEEDISRFFITEYSKSRNEKEARLYLPGRSVSEKIKGEKEYSVMFSPLFDIDSESLDGEISFDLSAYYHSTLAKMIYNTDTRELTLDVTNDSLNKYMGIEFGFSSAYYEPEQEISGQLKISYEF